MPIVKAKYFRTKVGDPNNPQEVPFLAVPQCMGHGEKEIQVSEDTVKGLTPGDTLDVDSHNLPYLREVPTGSTVGKLSDADVQRIAALLKK